MRPVLASSKPQRAEVGAVPICGSIQPAVCRKADGILGLQAREQRGWQGDGPIETNPELEPWFGVGIPT
jgi:hypothetical protein